MWHHPTPHYRVAATLIIALVFLQTLEQIAGSDSSESDPMEIDSDNDDSESLKGSDQDFKLSRASSTKK